MVGMTMFVTNIAFDKEVWRAGRECFRGVFPCSIPVEAAIVDAPEILVEIQVQAHTGSGT